MTRTADPQRATPAEADLGLQRISSGSGLEASLLPNGCLFALEHQGERGRIMVNQVLGSPLAGSIGRLYVRIRRPAASAFQVVGPQAKVQIGAAGDRCIWEGETAGIWHRVTLWLQPDQPAWLWQVELANRQAGEVACDAILVQDVGLGNRGFLMTNEAFASQYLDHHCATHPRFGPVVMSRQAMAQDGRHPLVLHGCLDGAAAYATDAMQLFGPAYRAAGEAGLAPLADLPNQRLQHEAACAMIQSHAQALPANGTASWSFFGLLDPDHPGAAGASDLARIDGLAAAPDRSDQAAITLVPARPSLLQSAPALPAQDLEATVLTELYPTRALEEQGEGQLWSFFVPDGEHNRHVVLAAKERRIRRRHGAILRTGQGMLLDETTMCVTGWMHGVFAAQLTLGNTSFHKLFSVSRDPYNIIRGHGLRILADVGAGWQLLTVPSAFEIGLSDCRWIYQLADRRITVQAIASGAEPVLLWQIAVAGPACRFLVVGHLVLGDRELAHAGQVAIAREAGTATFTPDPKSLWGQRYPDASYCLAVATPDALAAIGGDELLHDDERLGTGGYIALRSGLTDCFAFAVAGSLTDPAAAAALAGRYRQGVDAPAELAPAARYWSGVTRQLRLQGSGRELAALDHFLPWLVHDAMVHLTVPHGLEQYTGAAWGTRDVCQGPIELFLALEHDGPAKEILRIVFAQQSEAAGDWPQWFMLDPYGTIRDRHSHGDVIIWPLKALCDYLEATNDLAFLDEPIAWRRADNFEPTERRDPVAHHVETLLATVRARFIPGTHLIRYGEGDWNDSLQPADPKMRDWMASSWTVALLYQQLRRYAEVLRRAGRPGAAELDGLADAMRADFNRYLIRDDTVAGYALFEPGGAEPELLLHPSDRRTGLSYSLLPMTRSMIGGLFTAEQVRHHLALIREHLLFPDGVRLMDRPVRYQGGIEQNFRRAESSAYFGREIGLMYVHAHLRFAEAMAVLGDGEALFEALQLVNPVLASERVRQASPRQRNTYFSSSDAAFNDRYEAQADWAKLRSGEVAVDGGWRIYSSGPGIFVNLVVRQLFGMRRWFGERQRQPLLPEALRDAVAAMTVDGETRRSA